MLCTPAEFQGQVGSADTFIVFNHGSYAAMPVALVPFTRLACHCCRPDCPNNIIEFGAGDGSPVISALLKAAPSEDRVVNAYEIGTSAAKLATARAAQFGLSEQYVVRNSCFWQGLQETPCECLIANPPYLPAPGEGAATTQAKPQYPWSGSPLTIGSTKY